MAGNVRFMEIPVSKRPLEMEILVSKRPLEKKSDDTNLVCKMRDGTLRAVSSVLPDYRKYIDDDQAWEVVKARRGTIEGSSTDIYIQQEEDE